MNTLPSRTKVLVIGGGPAGAMSGILLAREGVDVTVCERDKFPRYHIGESMLPGIVPLLKFTDLFEQIDSTQIKKYGAWFKMKADLPPGVIRWGDLSANNYTWNVNRAQFDEILLRHAEKVGAKVFEETRITELEQSEDGFCAAQWERDGASGRIEFDYLIDASGLNGIIATRYHKDRVFQENFANVAIGGYWEGWEEYADARGIHINGAPFAESFVDGTGWIWSIPIPGGKLSVGVIMHVDRYKEVKDQYASIEDLYLAELARSKETKAELANARQVDKVRVYRDYSYASDRFSGKNYRLVGDAAAFIDPLFSQGIHMALLGGLSASATICSAMRGEWDADAMRDYHDTFVRRAYTQFLVILSGWYRQIRNQDRVMLTGVDRDNFQLAFDSITPVVSGLADGIATGVVPDNVLDRTMEYLTNIQMELHQYETDDEEARQGIPDVTRNIDNIGVKADHAILGRYIRMERGNLGIAQA